MKRISVLILILVVCIGIGGCKDSALTYERISIELPLEGEKSAYCCYSDDTNMIFSVGKRTGAQVGPLVDTENLIVFNHRTSEFAHTYPVASDAHVVSAVPYEEGILYIDYSVIEDAADYTLEWALEYMDLESNIMILDSGFVYDFYDLPKLCTIEGVPVYLYETQKNGEYAYGINRVDGKETKQIFCEAGGLAAVELQGNGSSYCFVSSEDDGGSLTFKIGDLTGVKSSVLLDGKITSFGLSSSHAICGISKEDGTYALQTVHLQNGTSENISVDRPLYRMSAGKSESAFCVDNMWTIFKLDLDKMELVEIEQPMGVSDEDFNVLFHQVSENEYIFEFGSKARAYFQLML